MHVFYLILDYWKWIKYSTLHNYLYPLEWNETEHIEMINKYLDGTLKIGNKTITNKNKQEKGAIKMIEQLPCGCVPIKLKNKKEAKERMLAGDLIWFDDNETFGFMKYYGGKVFSIVWIDDENGEAVFDLNRANQIIDEYDNDGYDFSYGDADIEVDTENGTVTICCTGK